MVNTESKSKSGGETSAIVKKERHEEAELISPKELMVIENLASRKTKQNCDCAVQRLRTVKELNALKQETKALEQELKEVIKQYEENQRIQKTRTVSIQCGTDWKKIPKVEEITQMEEPKLPPLPGSRKPSNNVHSRPKLSIGSSDPGYVLATLGIPKGTDEIEALELFFLQLPQETWHLIKTVNNIEDFPDTTFRLKLPPKQFPDSKSFFTVRSVMKDGRLGERSEYLSPENLSTNTAQS